MNLHARFINQLELFLLRFREEDQAREAYMSLGSMKNVYISINSAADVASDLSLYSMQIMYGVDLVILVTYYFQFR